MTNLFSNPLENMLEIQEQDAIVQLRMAHGKVNALDMEFCQKLNQTLDELESGPARAVVLTGNDRVFSAGIDLKRWLAEDESYVEPFLLEMERLFEKIFVFPKPMISVINGHAVAGGCMLAAACDYRLITPNARIGIPELRIGVPLPMTAIEIMRFVSNPASFQAVVNVGAMFEGSDAVANGIASEVVDGNAIQEAANRVAKEFVNVPAAAFAFTKKQTRSPALRSAEYNRKELYDTYMKIWKAPSTRATVAAYVKERL